MADGLRVLVASPQARVITVPLARALQCTAAAATSPLQLRFEVTEAPGYDVALVDLAWNTAELEYSFDGFEILAMLREARRPLPVIFAASGLGIEQDYVDELPSIGEVAGLVRKSAGLVPTASAVRIASRGRRLPEREFPPNGRTDGNSLHDYFSRSRRGGTAGRLAGAIASGRVSDARSLQVVTGLPLNTANKLTAYLAPLIRARHEVPRDIPVTAAVIHRWCGEHAHYLLSWCRRNGHADVAARFVP